MKLFSLKQVRKELDLEFEPLEPTLTGFRLLQASISLDEIDACQSQLQVIFPLNFKNIISQYDFGNLTIGSIVFGNSGNYCDELIELNLLFIQNMKEYVKDFIVIAISDSYLILLELSSGRVFGLDRDLSFDNRFFICINFETFIQATGTIMLLRDPSESNHELATQICDEIVSESLDFWQYLSS